MKLILLIILNLNSAINTITFNARTVKENTFHLIENFFYLNKYLSKERELGYWSNQIHSDSLAGLLLNAERIDEHYDYLNKKYIVYFESFNDQKLLEDILRKQSVLGAIFYLTSKSLNISMLNSVITYKPVFIIYDNQTRLKIKSFLNNFNSIYIEFQSQMIGFKNSQVCLRRSSSLNLFSLVVSFFGMISENDADLSQLCFAVYSTSVWAFLNTNTSKTYSQKSVTLVVTQLSNIDMFKHSSYSHKHTRSGSYSMIVLIALADLISNYKPKLIELNRTVVFALLGSEDDVYSVKINKSSIFYANKIKQNNFHDLSSDHIRDIIELDRIERPGENNFAFKINHSDQTDESKKIFCAHFNCSNSPLRNSSFINQFNDIDGLSISSDSGDQGIFQLLNNNTNILNHTIDLVIAIGKLILNEQNLNASSIDNVFLESMLKCFNWIDCPSLETLWSDSNDLLEVQALLHVLKNKSNDSNFLFVESLSINDTLARSNEMKQAKLKIYLKSNHFDYVSLVIGVCATLIMICFNLTVRTKYYSNLKL